MVVGGIAVVVLLGFAMGYNGLASGKVNIDQAQANIETAQQRQSDLIPNLVSATKGTLKHEDNAIKMVTDARKAYVGAQTDQQKAAAGDAMSSALGRLLVVVENYPQLKAQDTIKTLMDELESSQDRISFQRNQKNTEVAKYNRMVVTYPTKIVADMFGFKQYEQFKASSKALTTPSVNLNE
jgi:LemA protein